MNYIDQFVKQAEQLYERRKRFVRMIQAVATVIIITMAALLKTLYGEAKVEDGIQNEIADQIIRFHVIANSDSESDQEVKLKVKEAVVEYMQDRLALCTTKEEAKQILLSEEAGVRQIALNVLKENGFDYEVRIELSNVYFPVKVYGDLKFPSGYYDAYRILIGNAQGKNWWCVMFPSLCMVNETYSVVPDESKDKLKNVLDEEEYDVIDTTGEEIHSDASGDLVEEETEEVTTEYRFWLGDVLSNLF